MRQHILTLLFTILVSHTMAQNISSTAQTTEFAIFLRNSRQYGFAAEEFRRAIFLGNTNDSVKFLLINSLRLSGDFSAALQVNEDSYKQSFSTTPIEINEEYAKALLQNRMPEKFLLLADSLKYKDEQIKNHFLMLACLQLKQPDKCKLMLPRIYNPKLSKMAEEYSYAKFKSPLLAAILASTLPGSQSLYTKDYRNGLVTLLGVALNSWQAFNSFKSDGKESASGWFFGGLALGFYINGIHGAIKSTENYNKNIHNQTYEKAVLFDIDSL